MKIKTWMLARSLITVYNDKALSQVQIKLKNAITEADIRMWLNVEEAIIIMTEKKKSGKLH